MKALKSIIVGMSALCALNAEAQDNEYAKMLEYAVRAPSGHNTQPWKFRLLDSAIEIYPNMEVSLHVVDPDNRELYISLGAAAENLCIASGKFGYKPVANILKYGEGKYKIHIDLKKESVNIDPLLSQIEKRQTNRSVYEGKEISDDTTKIISKITPEKNTKFYLFKKNEAGFDSLKVAAFKGNEAQMNDDDFKKELKNWIRFNGSQSEESGDGLSSKVMGSPSVPKWLGKFIIGFFLNPSSQNKSDMEKINSSSHLVLFTTENNTPDEWISLGRTLERFLLKTTELGIANAYINMPCEVPELAGKIRKNVQVNNEYPAILVRIGYAHSAPYSMRRPLEKVIMKSGETE
jgi:hypothetical protein